jgi:transcriptional regulator with XRE-family HTH domain
MTIARRRPGKTRITRRPAAPHGAFGGRLATLRTGAALTQDELARRLGVSRRQIAYYESGQGRPPGALLGLIADEFQMSTDALLGRRQSAEALPKVSRAVLTRLKAIERLGARVGARLVSTLDDFIRLEQRRSKAR